MKMTEHQSIKETLNVIRKALEDDDKPNVNDINSNILILNKLVKDDGTINIIKDSNLNKKQVSDILKNKLDEVFDSHLSEWLDKNVPQYLEKYFRNKKS